jgi:acetyltransferase-like isoleucine patch superfamily enzyme
MVGPESRFGAGVRCVAATGGRIIIGRGVEIGAGTSLTAFSGAVLHVGDGAFISGGCTIAAANSVSIGTETMLAEMVSIRDHDHDPAYPPRSGRMLQEDVCIGARVWLGAKSTVGKGVVIGDDAVIGAHALVNRTVPSRTLAVGVPARVVREQIRRCQDSC